MKINRTIEIIQAMANGINPITGEVIQEDEHFQEPEIIRALFEAADALEHRRSSLLRRKRLPQNAGKPWSGHEELRLKKAFKEGESIADIAQSHGRTRGAIHSRLMKFNLISLEHAHVFGRRGKDNKSSSNNVDTLQNKVGRSANYPPGRECVDCHDLIPASRLQASPQALRCVACQSAYEREHPGSYLIRVDEGFAGTREGHKRMRGQDFADMIRRAND